MKILMINSVCGIGSTGRICTDLADILERKGHEVKIAYGRGNVPEKYQKFAVKIGTEIDVRVHAIKSRVFDNTGFGSKTVTKKFVEWIKSYNPDVIHLHNIHGYYINVEVLFEFLSKANKRVIWTMHDCWAFTGHCVYFSAIKCDKWKEGCRNCPQKREYPASIVLDNSSLNWRIKKELFNSIKDMIIITPSKWLAGLVEESFLSKYSVQVINNGIDTDVFKPTPSRFREKFGLKNKKIVLGVSNQWTERKGFNDFIKLSYMIDDNYKIVLVGLTKKQIKKLPNIIIGISKTQNAKELAEIYTTADVFLNLTYEDNYPTTNLEAQACGTPLITYNTGGSVESCIYKNVVQQGNLEAVIKAIKDVNFEEKISIISRNEMCSSYLQVLLGEERT